MYGPPPTVAPVVPAPPVRRAVTVGRVLVWLVIAVVLIGGVGIFACVPLAVLAVRSRARLDLWLAVGALVYAVAGCVAVSGQHDSTHPGLVAGLASVGMLAQGIAATAYYVVSDVRRARVLRPPSLPAYHFGPGLGPVPVPGAGAGVSPAGYAVPPQAQPPAQQPPMPSAPVTPPAPAMPAQAYRLGQVRAELDELSDYLRKEQGR